MINKTFTMSRSYRKPWIKDPANRYMKKLYARAYRRSCRQISHVFRKGWIDPMLLGILEVDDQEEPVYPHKHEVMDPYDICDYSFYIPRRIRYRHYGGRAFIDNTRDHLKACRK